ncbi:hypothetical protein ACKFKG_25330 [Phormidesmis sp. 146-35]
MPWCSHFLENHPSVVVTSAIAQDGRYGDRDFLKYLDEAGFSASQIAASREVLATL